MKRKIIIRVLLTITVLVSAVGCHKTVKDIGFPDHVGNALLFYECGFNSLGSYMYSDVNTELRSINSYIPRDNDFSSVLLVFSKLAVKYYKDKDGNDVAIFDGSYNPTKSYLMRLSRNRSGQIVSDTLLTLPETNIACSGATINKIISYVNDTFNPQKFGMVFSSHGSGWLPAGYYYDPSTYERDHPLPSQAINQSSTDPRELNIPQGSMDDDPFNGMVRSIGQEIIGKASEFTEMTTTEFADAIPVHLDYLLFDMCFSAGAELVYALKDKADYIGGSCAEVLADGMFEYTEITNYLLTSEPDLKHLMSDSFERYNIKNGQYQSSTITLVETAKLDAIAKVCNNLNEKYRAEIANVNGDLVQGYFRQQRHYFYDLEDIYAKAGVTEEDLKPLQDAIADAVVFKGATPYFLNAFAINPNTYSGLSMYLPSEGTKVLDENYKNESWNKATNLVK